MSKCLPFRISIGNMTKPCDANSSVRCSLPEKNSTNKAWSRIMVGITWRTAGLDMTSSLQHCNQYVSKIRLTVRPDHKPWQLYFSKFMVAGDQPCDHSFPRSCQELPAKSLVRSLTAALWSLMMPVLRQVFVAEARGAEPRG